MGNIHAELGGYCASRAGKAARCPILAAVELLCYDWFIASVE